MARARLRTRWIPRELRPEAFKTAKSGDPCTLFWYADSWLSLWIFDDNQEWFLERGLYEKALLAAWVNQKITYVIYNGWPIDWNSVMKRRYLPQSNRDRLLAASDPLPSGDTFTIYRGVALPDKQDLRGVSWTLNREVAQRFAGRLSSDGVIYRTRILRSMVYAYTGERSGRCGEFEMLLVLPEDYPISRDEEKALAPQGGRSASEAPERKRDTPSKSLEIQPYWSPCI